MIAVDYTALTQVDPEGVIAADRADRMVITEMTRDQEVYAYADLGSGFFSGDFVCTFHFRCTSLEGERFLLTEASGITLAEQTGVGILLEQEYRGGAAVLWGLANSLDGFYDLEAAGGDHLKLEWRPGVSQGVQRLILASVLSGPRQEVELSVSPYLDYYIRVVRETDGGTATLVCEIYNDSAMTDLNGRMALSLSSVTSYQYLYACGSIYDQAAAGGWSGIVADLAYASQITDWPVRVCSKCGAVYIEDSIMYEDPERCPACGSWPEPVAEGPDDDLGWV